MIESIRIEDLGVIEEADLQLGPGLTALTGETGAGKTMVLTSLGLLLGQRAASQVVRGGAQRAVVDGAFVVDPQGRAAARAGEAGAEMDDDVLLASRSVPAQGRSHAYLGGRAVPSAVLADVGQDLVSVHGQADQLRLREAAAQRAALDSLGGREHARRCRRYAAAYRTWRQREAELEQWRRGAREREREVETLRGRMERMDQLAASPGEDAALTAEAARLDHAEDLRRAVGRADAMLSGSEETGGLQDADVLALLAQVGRSLEEVAALDPVLEEQAQRVRRLAIDAGDVADELGQYLAGIDADPARLAWVQDRRAELSRACRELGEEPVADVDALLEAAEDWRRRLDALDGPVDRDEQLVSELAQAREDLEAAAGELTAARTELAGRFEQEVGRELAGLQMSGARLVVGLTALDEPGPTGAEQVSLSLVAHPGAPALPLGRGASGGELSRIMLAIELVLAQAAAGEDGQAPRYPRTLVFDEIDAGVGGRAAGEIGRRLARLARTYQVIVVTHLAQVAAWAGTQLVVRKETADDGRARTSVTAVSGEERERELARMLSGHEASQAARQHAAELLGEAAGAHMAQSAA